MPKLGTYKQAQCMPNLGTIRTYPMYAQSVYYQSCPMYTHRVHNISCPMCHAQSSAQSCGHEIGYSCPIMPNVVLGMFSSWLHIYCAQSCPICAHSGHTLQQLGMTSSRPTPLIPRSQIGHEIGHTLHAQSCPIHVPHSY